MKVAIIILNYLRYDYAGMTVGQNLIRAGHPYGLIVIDKLGIAKAMNTGLKKAIGSGYDHFAFLSNDIFEPDLWLLKKIQCLQEDKSGIVSTHIHKQTELQQRELIGNYFFSKKLVDDIGLFDENYDPYGPIDLDFSNRAFNAGYKNYYISDTAEHINEHGERDMNNIYGFSKKEMIEKTWKKYSDSVK